METHSIEQRGNQFRSMIEWDDPHSLGKSRLQLYDFGFDPIGNDLMAICSTSASDLIQPVLRTRFSELTF